MNHRLQHSQEIPPPPKLRRLVASYWKQPDCPNRNDKNPPPPHQGKVPVPVTPIINWEFITQGPPASGSYEYYEHYYGSQGKNPGPTTISSPAPFRHGPAFDPVSPAADTLPRDFQFHHPTVTATNIMIHKPKAKPFYKAASYNNEPNSTNHMIMMKSTPVLEDDDDDDEEMSMGTALADDSQQIFETVKQAVVQFGGGGGTTTIEENDEDDAELAEFLHHATHHSNKQQDHHNNNNDNNNNSDAIPGTITTGMAGKTSAMTMMTNPDGDSVMFQAITPSPDPIIIINTNEHRVSTTERKLPPILPPLHRYDEMMHHHHPSRAVRLTKKKYSSYPPPFFSATTATASSSLGSIPREIIAPVVYPDVVVATQGHREDPMDPRFGIEHPPADASW
jgi:hypothetical protein